MSEIKKILIVEDEKIMADALADRFKQEGFKVFTAQDGELGLKTALTEKPEIILLDILLPKMDGLAVLKQLRSAGDWGKKVPIIMLTNLNADDKILENVVEDRPTFYLIKADWTLDKIVEKVRESLRAA